MGRKCSVVACRTNYKNESSRKTVYGFPLLDRDQLEKWVPALPNVIKISSITKNMGICEDHWPADAPKKKIPGGHLIPTVPPSIFKCPSSTLRQTVSFNDSNSENRGVLPSKLNSFADELETFNDLDRIPSNIQKFHEELLSRSTSYGNIIFENDSVFILKINSTSLSLEYIIQISSDFTLSTRKHSTKVAIPRNYLGFQKKLSSWSQLESIIQFVKNSSVSFLQELQQFSDNIRQCNLQDVDQNALEILLELLELSGVDPNGRRYSAKLTLTSLNLYLRNKNCYKLLRSILPFPHSKSLTFNLGPFHQTASEDESQRTCRLVFQDSIRKECGVILDEVHVAPSIHNHGDHIVGYSEDVPDKLARTVLAIMVKPLFSKKRAFVLRLIPIYSLKADYLQELLKQALDIIHKSGVKSVFLMTDNHTTNSKLHSDLRIAYPSPDPTYSNFAITHPVDSNSLLYLLFDPVHLLKCIRNKWINSKSQQLYFTPPNESSASIASWSDIIDLYKKEQNNSIKRTTLTYSAVNPSPFDHQKVSLVTTVFNDKTLAALIEDNKTSTASFVFHILKLWKILNNRSLHAHVHLNDPDRAPITHKSQLEYLVKLSESFKSSQAERRRDGKLTKQTFTALTQTLDGIVSMASTMLKMPSIKYILLGHFQSDCIEGEFGCYRQMFGGLYHISFEQVLIAAKCRRLQLFSQIDSPPENLPEAHSAKSCCTDPLTEKELSSIDDAPFKVYSLSDTKRSSLFYVAGYIAKKEGHTSNPNSADDFDFEDKEFFNNLNRGLLTIPSRDLFHFTLSSYVFFKTEFFTCSNRLKKCLTIIHDHSFNFCNVSSICSRLANTFFSGYVTKVNDSVVNDKNERKRIKLSA